MNEIVKVVLSLSLSGSILALFVLVLKPLIRHKVSKSIQFLLWIVVVFRFLLPFSFESSFINELFYNRDVINHPISSQNPITQNSDSIDKTLDSTDPNYSINLSELSESSKSNNSSNSSVEAQTSGFHGNVAHSQTISWEHFIANLKDLLNRYALYIWILGILTVLIYNLAVYIRFIKQIKKSNIPTTDEQNQVLNNLLNGRYKLKLFLNPYVETPMLIGVASPMVIIPDIDFSERQLKYILLHEINHMKRFDIAVKWLTTIAQSIHWFNPLMYLVRKEINHACELACDEAVIKSLSEKEKQDYGDTLIDVAAVGKHHIGALQATMYEEKKSLKDRLIAIMNHKKKSKAIILLSVVLFVSVIAGALYLGAGIGMSANTPNIYISAEYENTKTAVIGTYSWNSVHADSVSPLDMKYKPDNVVNISSRQQLSISTQKLKIDRKYDFTLKSLKVYKDGKKVQFESPETSIMNGVLYCQAPIDSGEYIYEVILGFKDRGQVSYYFVVRVDMMTFDLNRISKFRTPYVGDAPKVSDLAQNLPPPEKSFNQRYISLETNKRPYGLTMFYELKYDGTYVSEWPLIKRGDGSYSNLQKNALVLFCMIDNVDKVTFAFRKSPSDGKLDEAKYDSKFTFLRSDYERYGDLFVLGKDLHRLLGVLEGKNIDIKAIDDANNINKQEFSNEEIMAASAVIEEYFRAVKAKDEKAILKTLTPRYSGPNVRLYGDETVTLISSQGNSDDPMRYSYVQNGRGKINGTNVENVIVFKVKYNVHYPKGVVTGPLNEGDYSDWNVILVRKDKNSPWLIDDQGY
ncbi:M56 family metallopeptidase [Pseudobacteroides cellulosolvens]|uniref:Peptidase M56 BlaR1 n=1 Tax=Pseudobacteroides cellulosolvens ATCC 35603 = DSM 2933 TaxID=398512 RepID=A0A0L6JWD7_9FIRM|nr:M56 family metallopeptidase [Pseudobacteroides cellulosolvens]KNY29930.1 peptidase M56 BlaR1 [Pseudobacteroides cellulosolvens ATCC 35603 = DSM 2933]